MRLSEVRETPAALLAAGAGVALVAGSRAFHVSDPTIAALALLTVVLGVAATSTRRLAIASSFAAMLVFNYFFLPPIGTLRIASLENWVALGVFLVVSLVASSLSEAVRARAEEAAAHRSEAELARRSEELKSSLLDSLAHDLKTPLTAIRVAAANLQAGWPSDEQRREQSDIVLTEVSRLQRLFESILDMTRIEAGAVSTSREWVDPAELVDAARARVSHALARHTVAFEEGPAQLVNIDPRLTTAALAHLLENAAAYAPPGSTITVTTAVTTSGLGVTVRDQGPGIAAEDLPHLFDRFYRGRAGRGVPGTGMGLAIARGLLAVEGGQLSARNHPDGGAIFSLTLAAETRPPAPAAEAVS